jgi:hypothetical protein
VEDLASTKRYQLLIRLSNGEHDLCGGGNIDWLGTWIKSFGLFELDEHKVA